MPPTDLPVGIRGHPNPRARRTIIKRDPLQPQEPELTPGASGGAARRDCPQCQMSADPGVEFCHHCGAKIGQRQPVTWWHIHRRLYDWTLGWAYHRSSQQALFGLSFAESSFFPIPTDVLLMPLVLGDRARWLRFAFLCTAGSVLGALLGYALGHYALQLALMIPGIDQEGIDWLSAKFNEHGQLYVFVAALTPIPFKLLTITAGVATMNLLVFTAACIVGRAARFFLVAWMMHRFGPTITPLIDKYFNKLALLFGVLLIGGFVAVKYVF